MPVDDVQVVSNWIYPVLSADTAGAGSLGVLSPGITSRVYDTNAPHTATFPYIVFHLQAAGEDLMTMQAHRIWAQLLMTVKVVGKEQAFSVLSPIMGRVDFLIHAKVATVAGAGELFAFYRDRPIRFSEKDSGITYQHVGGVYRALPKAT